MLLGYLDDGEDKAEDEVKTELPLVARDKPEEHYLRLTVDPVADDDPLLYQRLSYLSFDLVQCVADRREGDDDFSRNEAGAESFDDHELEPISPFVAGDLVVQQS